jgi:hypothetical protein
MTDKIRLEICKCGRQKALQTGKMPEAPTFFPGGVRHWKVGLLPLGHCGKNMDFMGFIQGEAEVYYKSFSTFGPWRADFRG